jgi:hypothetical protein
VLSLSLLCCRWDDDIDVMCACEIGEPCWKLMFDINSPLHAALNDRGLAMHIGSPDDHRHMLKVYSRRQFVAHQIKDWYTFPNLDIFLSKPIRCNVSDGLDSAQWSALQPSAAESPRVSCSDSDFVSVCSSPSGMRSR